MLLKAAVGVAAASLVLAGCQAGTSSPHPPAASARPVPAVASGPGSAAALTARSTGRLLTCSDFTTQAAADAYLRTTPAARPLLDTNGDGIACGARFAPRPTPRRTAAGAHSSAPGTSTRTGASSTAGSGATKPICPVDRGPVSGNWCQHSANGPDNPGFVPQCPVPGLPKVQWPAAVDGRCS